MILGIGIGIPFGRRKSVAFETEYENIINYAIAQGYTLPSAAQQIKQNKLLKDLKDAGIWAILDTFSVYARTSTSDFALIDWKRLAQRTAVNSPTFNATNGFSFNGTSSYIDWNFNPNTLVGSNNYKLTNAGIFNWTATAGISALNGMLGTVTAVALRIQNANLSTNRINSGSIASAVDLSGTGLKVANKTGSNAWTFFNNTTETSGTGGGDSNVGTNLADANSAGSFWDGGVAVSGAGANLASFNTQLFNAINTYLS